MGPLYESDSEDEEPYVSRGNSNKIDPVSGLQYGKDWNDSQKKVGAKSHYNFSTANSRELTDFEVPRDIICAAEKMSDMTPNSHIAFVRRNMRYIRSWARKLRKKNLVSRSKLAAHVRRVHSATSPDGIHIELLSKLLEDSSFPDAKDLIRDMKKGFRLVGKIQTSKSAKKHPVRKRQVNNSKLREQTRNLTRNIRKSILRVPSNPEQAKLEHSVYTQTLEDIRKKSGCPLSPKSTTKPNSHRPSDLVYFNPTHREKRRFALSTISQNQWSMTRAKSTVESEWGAFQT